MSLVGAWLGGKRFEIPVAYASWRDRAKVHHARVVYAHCIDLSWPWWYPVSDEELELCRPVLGILQTTGEYLGYDTDKTRETRHE